MLTERPLGVLSPTQAMERAISLASLGPQWGPNPRVGCVITDKTGALLAEGWHKGAGTAHAEAAAIASAQQAGVSLQGATAYVTLEPCSHTGRTGPCTDALTAAGVSSVVYAVQDPNPQASGGAEVLRQRGISATYVPSDSARDLNHRWLTAVTRGRPYVIAKWAQTLDGRVAAIDGSSFWITGEAARDHAHGVRATVDGMVVGTGTVKADNPSLSARPGGVPSVHQPLRVVMGYTDTTGSDVWRDDNSLAVATHDPSEVLAALAARDVRTVIVEGGATVITAFLKSGLVDEIHAYVAPAIVGSGVSAIGDLGMTSLSQALRPQPIETLSLGDDTLIRALLTAGPQEGDDVYRDR